MSLLRSLGPVLVLGFAAASTTVLPAQEKLDSTARAAVTAERALRARSGSRRTVAVLPFTVTSRDSTLAALGYGLAEFLSDDLAHSHRLVMVERARLSDLQREQTATLAGNISPGTAVRVGRLIAAQHLIYGAIDVRASGALTIDERSADVETGTVEMHRKSTTSLDDVLRAERDLVLQTFSAFGVTLTADEKKALYERVAPLFRAFVAFSRGARAEQMGDDMVAATSYQEAVAIDPRFKLAAVKLATVQHSIAIHAATPASTVSPASPAPIPASEAGAKDAGKEPAVKVPVVKDATPEPAASAAKTTTGAPVAGSSPSGSAPVGGSAPGGTLSKPSSPTTTTTKTGATTTEGKTEGTAKKPAAPKRPHPKAPTSLQN